MQTRSRVIGFLVITVICVVVAVYFLFQGMRRSGEGPGSDVAVTAEPSRLATALREPHVLFRNTALGNSYGRVSAALLREPGAMRYATTLACDRVDFNGGTGVCLVAKRGVVTTYKAQVFDASFSPSHDIPLAGVPSRVRVAPNGELAGVTVFVSGHSYASVGFSTQTTLIDTRKGTTLANLEQFTVTRDGKRFAAADFNFWGVTFTADSNTFLATLASGNVFYLVRGDAGRQAATVIGEGVECAALSPDNTRIAYKKRVVEGGRLIWHLAVRSLETGVERVLDQETRSIDDQVEWLDNDNILYGASDEGLGTGRTSVWALSVNGGAPRKWLVDAFSPAVF